MELPCMHACWHWLAVLCILPHNITYSLLLHTTSHLHVSITTQVRAPILYLQGLKEAFSHWHILLSVMVTQETS
jgi:hypothetical protein